MDDSMRQVELQLLTHVHALRALARVLVGERHADDVVQDTAVQVMGSADAPRSRAWLFGVLRHRAHKLLRSEGRRARREAAAPAPQPMPSPQRVLEHRETLQRLTAAIAALREPCASTIWLRFFESLPPAAIAAKTGERLATVKARLQRGLATLRARLEADDGNWRAGLCTAFGFEPVAAAGAAGPGGVLLANATTIVLAAAAVVVAAWWLLRPEPAAMPPFAAAGGPDVGALAAAPRMAGGGRARAADERADATPATGAAVASISGRCVDDRGRPVAGCEITLHGGDGATFATRGDADGRFVLRCAASGVAIRLAATASGRAAAERSFPRVEPGQHVDAGELVVARARDVRVRTVGADGRPVPRAWLAFWRQPMVRTGEDGVATVRLRLGGNVFQAVPPATIAELDVPDGDDVWDTVVPLAGESSRIEGVVVDETGAPLAGARVEATAAADARSSARAFAWTTADGGFALGRSREWPGPPGKLAVAADGHEPTELGNVPWDTRSLRIVLRRGLTVELHVRTADGRPVERFRAWLRARPHWGARALQVAGTFPGGVACLDGARRGAAQVSVQPEDGDLAPLVFAPVDLSDATKRVDVVVPRVATRTLLVRGADGSPCEGVAFDLVHRVGSARPRIGWVGRLEGDLVGFDVGGELDGDLQPAVLLQQGVTDAQGRAELRGPGDVELVVRVHGDVNRVVDRVLLTGAGPVLVELSASGGVRGRIGPPALLAALRELPGRTPGERADAIRIGFHAGADVAGAAGGERVEAEVGRDGRFEKQGLSPGTWSLSFAVRARQSGLSLQHRFATVRVSPGVTIEQDGQFAELLPGTVRGVVTAGGAPVAGAELTLFAAPEHAATRRPARCTVGDDGRFEVVVLPATYRAMLTLRGTVSLPTELQLVVAPGATVVQDLDFAVGRARLRLVDAHGRAAVGIVLRVARGGRTFAEPAPTDANGVTELLLPPGTYELSCWRRDVQPAAARAAAERSAPGPEQLPQARLPIGSIELPPGERVERELRLPDGWSR